MIIDNYVNQGCCNLAPRIYEGVAEGRGEIITTFVNYFAIQHSACSPIKGFSPRRSLLLVNYYRVSVCSWISSRSEMMVLEIRKP